LLRDGYLLQLLEEPGAFAVAVEMLCSSHEPVSQREEAKIDGRWAADILAGSLSPITVLELRLGRQLPPVVSAVVAATRKQPLRRVSWRKSLRRHLGPVLVPHEETTVTLHFEFDQISSPGSKVDYEIEAIATGSSTDKSEHALRQLFSHAGIKWQPLTVRHWPAPAITRSAGTRG